MVPDRRVFGRPVSERRLRIDLTKNPIVKSLYLFLSSAEPLADIGRRVTSMPSSQRSRVCPVEGVGRGPHARQDERRGWGHDFALALDTSAHGEYAGRQDDSAVPLENLRPDDETGDTGFGFEGDEHHDTLGASGPLTDENDSGRSS
jgi:hypothetical protein